MAQMRLGRVTSPEDDYEDNPDGADYYRSSDEAYQSDVVPRSRGIDPLPSWATAAPAPSQAPAAPVAKGDAVFTFPSAMPAAAAQAQRPKPSTDDQNVFTFPSAMAAAAPKAEPETSGPFVRGLKSGGIESAKETAVGGAALLADTFGAKDTATKLYGQYQSIKKEAESKAQSYESFSNVTEGKASFGDFLSHWAGYAIGQAAQTVIAAGAGAVGGSVLPGAGTAAGAIAGVFERGAAQVGIKKLVAAKLEQQVAAKVAEGAAKGLAVAEAEKLAYEAAAKSVFRELGVVAAVTGQNIGMEGASIYGEARDEAEKKGEELNLARVWTGTILAAATESAMDMVGLKGIAKAAGGGNVLKNIAVESFKGGLREGTTEAIQTGFERYGAGKELSTAEAIRDYIDSAAAGTVGGVLFGTAKGATKSVRGEEPAKITMDEARSMFEKKMDTADGRQELFDAFQQDTRVAAALKAANITDPTDPNFDSVMAQAIRSSEQIKAVEPKTPEQVAATTKERGADVQAAFGDTASTGVGVGMGGAEGVIRRDSVTPDPANKVLNPIGAAPEPVILPEGQTTPAGTVAQSPEDMVARQQGFDVHGAFTVKQEDGTEKVVGNRFTTLPQAETFLFGPINKETGKREGGYAENAQGTEFQIRKGKRSKEQGGGTFFFAEFRPEQTPAQKLDEAAHQAATSPLNDKPQPTDGQKAAGNYAKGHVKAFGIDIAVENPQGSERSGTDPTGRAWTQKMAHHYGYVKGTIGNDKDSVDVFIGPNLESNKVFVVDQVNKDGSFDEHKAMLGFDTAEEAKAGYLANYEPGWTGAGAISEMPVDAFKSWVKDGKKRAPLAATEPVKATTPAVETTPQTPVKSVEPVVTAPAIPSQPIPTAATPPKAATPAPGPAATPAPGPIPAKTEKPAKAEPKPVAEKPDRKTARTEATELWEDEDDGKADHIPFARLPKEVQAEWVSAYAPEDGEKPYASSELHDKIVARERNNERKERSNKKAAENRKGRNEADGIDLKRSRPTRDFAYVQLKTVNQLQQSAQNMLNKEGQGQTIELSAVPVGSLVRTIPGIGSIERAANLFGKKVKFFKVIEGADFFDGAVIPGSDTIFINVNTKYPHLHIFGHELVHAIKNAHPETYNRLKTFLTPMLNEKGMSQYARRQQNEGVKNSDRILEEAIGDIVGDRFGESEFWKLMADENPSLFKQLAEIVNEFIDKVLSKLKSKYPNLGSNNLVNDLNAVRSNIASVLKDLGGMVEQEQSEKKQGSKPQTEQDVSLKRTNGETFYSALKRAFHTVKQEKMSAEQWKGWIKSSAGKLGVKQEEIEWVGINDWLDLQQGNVTRQQIIDFVGGNQLHLNDVILSGKGEYLADEDLRAEFTEQFPDGNMTNDPLFMDRGDLLEELGKEDGGTKHNNGRFVLPGGRDYVEIVVTTPSKRVNPYKKTDTIHFGDVSGGKALGWLRMNVRDDVNGNHVLFIEEIQSQRGQDGRDQGFETDVKAKLDAYDKRLLAGDKLSKEDQEDYNDLTDGENKAVPDAPMVGETKAWTALLLKRAIAYAQEQGIDRIAWTTGDQQVDRYRLSKSIDEVTYVKNKQTGKVTISATKDGWTVTEKAVRSKKIASIVGKDLAKQIESNNGLELDNDIETSGVISGLDLDIGGDGLRYYYNTTVGSVAKSVIQKFGGSGSVEQFAINLDHDASNNETHEWSDASARGVLNRGGEIYVTDGHSETRIKSIEELDAEIADNGTPQGYILGDRQGNSIHQGFVIPEKLQQTVAEDGLPMFRRKDYEAQFADLPESVRTMAVAKGFYSPPNIKDRLESMKNGMWQRVVQGMFDRYRAIRDVSQRAYEIARLSGSVDGAISSLLHFGHVKMDDGALNVVKGTKGLLEILKPVGNEVDRYLLWVAANRADKLSQIDKERFFTKEEIIELKKLNLGTLKDGKSRPAMYAEVQRQMNELNKSVLDVALSTGLIDQAAHKRFTSDIWYVPFYRQMENEESLSGVQTSSALVGQKMSKALKGSSRALNDLLENVLLNWSHILSASMKNHAATETLQSATELGGVVSKVTKVDEKFGKAKDGSVVPLKGTVKVMKGGQEVHYAVEDELLLDSLVALSNSPAFDPLTKTARAFKTTLTRFVSLSPTFKINNLIRDSIQSIGLSDLGANPLANIKQGWKAFANDRAEALMGGGLFAMGNAYDGDMSAHVKRMTKIGVDDDSILTTTEKAKKWFNKALEAYDEFSDAAENSNRIALYQQLRSQGKTHREAAFQARDLQDFSLQGSWAAIRYASQILPYFNARLQGMYKIGREGVAPSMAVALGNATDSERQKAAKFGVVLGAVTAASLVLYLSQKDDDDWRKREDWDRDGFFWFKVPGTDMVIRIPKPFEMGAFASIVERFTEQIVDKDVEGKVFGQRLLSILSDNLAINPVPQIVRPAFDVSRNKDGFTGRPIESMGMERLSPDLRTNPGTSAAATVLGSVNSFIAEAGSAITGNSFDANKAKLSPLQYDYLLRNYLGWVGMAVMTTSDLAVRPFKAGESSDFRKIDDFLVVGNFIKSLPQQQSRYVTSFYENAGQIATAVNDYKAFLSAGEDAKAIAYYESKGDQIMLGKLYSRAAKQMSAIQKQIKAIQLDTEMSGPDKRLEMDRLNGIRIEVAKNAEEARITTKRGE